MAHIAGTVASVRYFTRAVVNPKKGEQYHMALMEIPEQFNIVLYMLDRHLLEGRGDRPAIYSKDGITKK